MIDAVDERQVEREEAVEAAVSESGSVAEAVAAGKKKLSEAQAYAREALAEVTRLQRELTPLQEKLEAEQRGALLKQDGIREYLESQRKQREARAAQQQKLIDAGIVDTRSPLDRSLSSKKRAKPVLPVRR